MDAVFGDGPLARELGAALGRYATVSVVGPRPVQGPFFWRRGDVTTGQAVLQTLRDARRAFVVVERAGVDLRAFFQLLKPDLVTRGVLVVPLETPLPKELKHHPDWSVVQCAAPLGPGEPLIDAWAAATARQQRVWVANPGILRPIAMADAVSAIRAAAGFRGLRWTIAGDDAVTLPELADILAEGLDVPTRILPVPFDVAMRRAGLDADRIRGWLSLPEASWHTPGWTPRELVGRAGWLGEPTSWADPPT
jgi:uncharacterized protein YbjT (DUF2867 family)